MNFYLNGFWNFSFYFAPYTIGHVLNSICSIKYSSLCADVIVIVVVAIAGDVEDDDDDFLSSMIRSSFLFCWFV